MHLAQMPTGAFTPAVPVRAPARKTVTVTPSGAYAVAVHDLLGRVLVQQRLDLPSVTAVHPLDLSALPSGAYFVRVTDGKGAAVRRVVVE